jgi:NYN domain
MKNSRRSIHLIDIENQLGTGLLDSEAVTAFFECYKVAVAPGRLDHFVVAVSSRQGLLELPLSSMKGFRLLYRPGHDGGDLALQEVMFRENLGARFDKVICASGDGGFVEAVTHLTSQGTRVVVVAPQKSLAKRLRLAAHQTIELTTNYSEKDAA